MRRGENLGESAGGWKRLGADLKCWEKGLYLWMAIGEIVCIVSYDVVIKRACNII